MHEAKSFRIWFFFFLDSLPVYVSVAWLWLTVTDCCLFVLTITHTIVRCWSLLLLLLQSFIYTSFQCHYSLSDSLQCSTTQPWLLHRRNIKSHTVTIPNHYCQRKQIHSKKLHIESSSRFLYILLLLSVIATKITSYFSRTWLIAHF